jgi:hypothetical protein
LDKLVAPVKLENNREFVKVYPDKSQDVGYGRQGIFIPSQCDEAGIDFTIM